MKCVVDTNIINWLIDGKIDKSTLPNDGSFFVTHLQVDELNRTADEDRRSRLMLTLASSLSGILPTETTVTDVTRWDHAKLGDGLTYAALRAQLDSINGGRQSNIIDALIAEVCIVNKHTLLTADRDLARVTEAHGGMVRFFKAV